MLGVGRFFFIWRIRSWKFLVVRKELGFDFKLWFLFLVDFYGVSCGDFGDRYWVGLFSVVYYLILEYF